MRGVHDPDAADRLLRFWWTVELFNPQQIPALTPEPGSGERTILWRPGDPLPWTQTPQDRLPGGPRDHDAPAPSAPSPGGPPPGGPGGPDAPVVWRHEVYLGVYQLRHTYDWISHAFGTDPRAYSEGPRRSSACAFVRVDGSGHLEVNTAVLSSALWGVGRIRHDGPDTSRWASAFREACSEFVETVASLALGRRDPASAPAPLPVDEYALADLLRAAHTHVGVTGLPALATNDVLIRSVATRPAPEARPLPAAYPPTSAASTPSTSPALAPPPPPTATEVAGSDRLNSLFLTGLERVRQGTVRGDVGPALALYLTPDDVLDTTRRCDLAAHPEVVTSWVAPHYVPPGRWPADPERPLARGQQLAVNRALAQLADAPGLLAVNAPPGTGRTAVLRDILAANVVERARRLATLASPRDAFDGSVLSWRTTDGVNVRRVHPLIPEVTGFEMLLAAADLDTVDRLNAGIPDRRGLAARWRGRAGYFAPLAGALSAAARTASSPAPGTQVSAPGAQDPAASPGAAKPPGQQVPQGAQAGTPPQGEPWVLAAAHLGSRQHRLAFRSTFWSGRQPARTDGPDQPTTDTPAQGEPAAQVAGMQETLRAWASGEAKVVSWSQATARFNQAYQQVERLLQARREAAERLERTATLAAEEERLQERIVQAEAEIRPLRLREAQAERVAQVRADILAQVAAEHREYLERRPRFLATALKGSAALRAWREGEYDLEQRLSQATEANAKAQVAHTQAAAAATSAQNRLSQLTSTLRAAGAEQHTLRRLRARDAGALGESYPPPDDDPSRREARERRTPWLTPSLDTARTELFLAALHLHRAFLSNTASIMLRSLRGTMDVMTGKAPSDLEPRTVQAAWQTLFLVVPLVCTTFAAADRMLRGLPREGLGWLLVDDAGRAAPQQTVPVLWHARSAVVLGDPFQTRPAPALPPAAAEGIAVGYEVSATWIPPRASVQTLADRVCELGTSLGRKDQPVWVGTPLRVRYRCDEPMLSLSNELAYHGLMVPGARQDPPDPHDVFSLPASAETRVVESFWADSPATTAGTHVQPDEVVRARKVLDYLGARGVPMTQVMALSPFQEVAEVLADLGRDYPGLGGGTIDDAPGGRADVVLLVLGGDPLRPGAKTWASGDVKAANTVLSRARRRIYVFGDYASWSTYPYFRDIAAALRRVR